MRGILSGALLALCVAATAQAGAEEDEEICVLVPRAYSGTVAEMRDLVKNPVPDSFRAALAPDAPCGGFRFPERTLVRLHLDYGDEKSATAALDFIDFLWRENLPVSRAEAIAEAKLRAAALTALADAEAAANAAVGEEALLKAGEAFDAAFAKTPWPAEESYLRLAALVMNAAEFHQSALLLKRAVALSNLARMLVEETARRRPAALPTAETQRLARETVARGDLDIRIALLTAQLTRDPGDVDAAHALIVESFDPLYHLDARYAENHLQSICDTQDASAKAAVDALPGARAQCADPLDLHKRAQDFWYRLSMVQMLIAADRAHFRTDPMADGDSVSAYVRRPPSQRASKGRESGPDPVGATDAARWRHADLARRHAVANEDGDDDRSAALRDQAGLRALAAARLLPRTPYYEFGDSNSAYEVRDELRRALAVIPPRDNPALQRRLAEAFVGASNEIAILQGGELRPEAEAERRFYMKEIDRLRCGAFCD